MSTSAAADARQIEAPFKRGLSGQFAPGNPGGPGNPYARKVAFLRESINECVSSAQVKNVMNAIYTLALGGSVSAARLFLQYAVGKPQEASNPDRVEIDEWQLRQDSLYTNQELQTQYAAPPLAMTNMLMSMSEHKKATAIADDLLGIRTPTFAEPTPQQTEKTAQAPAGKAAGVPKATMDTFARACAQHTTNSAQTDRHQTAPSADPHRHQTAPSADPHRHQTVSSAPQETAPSNPKPDSRVHTA